MLRLQQGCIGSEKAFVKVGVHGLQRKVHNLDKKKNNSFLRYSQSNDSDTKFMRSNHEIESKKNRRSFFFF